MGKVQFNLSYGQAKDDISDREQTLMASGVDYHISKQLKVYLIYAALKLDNSAKEYYFFGGAGRNELLKIDSGSDEVSSISFGVRYFFKPGYKFKIFEKKKR